MIARDNLLAQRESAARLCELSRFDEALAVLGPVVAADPGDPRAWCLVAIAQLGREDHDGALQAAESAVALAPEEEWPFRLASIALEKLQRQEEAVQAAREAVRLAPQEWRAFTRLAMVLRTSKGEADEGLMAAQRAVALAPDESDAHLAVGSLSLQVGRREEGEAALRRALELNPQSAAAHNELARLHLKASSFGRAGTLAEAAEGFARAVRADPRTMTSRNNLEVVLRFFLISVAYLVFLDTSLVQRLLFQNARQGERYVPLILLAVPAVFAWRFVHGLSTELRHHLWRLLFQRKVRVAVVLESVAVTSLIAGTFLPVSAHNLSVTVAAGSAILGGMLLYAQGRASVRDATGLAPRPMLSTATLWIIAGVFSLTVLSLAVVLATLTPSAKTMLAIAVALGLSALCLTGVYLTAKTRSSRR